MAGIYIYSDKDNIAAELIGFAKGAGQEARVIVFSQEAAQALKNAGADRIYILKGESSLPENYGQALARLLKKEGAELLAVGATARGRDLAARVAGYLDCGMVSDISGLNYAEGKTNTEKLIYGGAVVQQEVMDGLSVVTVPAGRFETRQGEAEIVTIEAEADLRVKPVATEPIKKTGVELGAAEKVVCIGLGIDKEEDIRMARDLAGVLGAEIGCTRGVAEERHWLPPERYIGISGAVIKPQLYLSMGVSGQVQHTVGIRDAKIIVAVNQNEKAPIFRAADYGIAGDMYEIIPLLTEALQSK